MVVSTSKAVSADRVETAALQLAISAREFLGLPVEPHDTVTTTEAPVVLPYVPPMLLTNPGSLEFARRLTAASPFMIQAEALNDRPQLQQWKEPGYLVKKMGDKRVKVSVTPDGQADDLKCLPDGTTVFVLPAETNMTFAELMSKVNASSSTRPASPSHAVYYLQSQNSNLTDESGAAGDLSALLQDALDLDGRSDIPWATEAIGSPPEALNIWLGSTRSRSSMHRDHYENLFYCLRGTKIFTVFPPTEAHYLCEGEAYQVFRHSSDNSFDLIPDPEGAPPTPWIPVNSTQPPTSPRNRVWPRYAKGLKPLEIRVEEGQMLFLPAGWYHHVAQISDSRPEDPTGEQGGACIALNWWYKSEAAFGPSWALLDFVKTLGDAVQPGASG